ncbi:MAG: hypothetical protein NW200_11625 [Hyphomonadaceae bacterium]|nr:hypothetical protein [Hyphomonadaceae bacterium]
MTEQTQASGARRMVGRLALWSGLIGAVLLAPLVAMQVADAVVWTASDFALMGGLLAAVAVTYEIAARRGAGAYRAAAGTALATAFLLVWANGAVGVIGPERHPANLMMGAVLAVAIAGAAFVRGRAGPMAVVLCVTAAAQVVVGVLAGVTMAAPGDAVGPTALFTALWLGSAALFARAARRRDKHPASPS